MRSLQGTGKKRQTSLAVLGCAGVCVAFRCQISGRIGAECLGCRLDFT